MNPNPKVLILKNHLSPGDVLAMTAAVYSLHKAHPGQYLTAVDTTADQLWEHNPDVITKEEAKERQGEEMQTHYPLINESNQRAVHFLQGYCDYFTQELKVQVPLLTNRPHLYLSAQERGWLPQVQEITGKPPRYWVICAGRKSDYTAKFWGVENYQRLVDMLRGRILFVQIGEAGHHHPPLRNVLNLVGKTDLRQLIRLCWHADGGVGGVTLLQHVMAGLEKPYVCIMGGREPVNWNSYPKQQLLHTVGAMPCCREGGCWKSRTVALNDGSEQDGSLCADPVFGEETIPRCMALIRSEEVAQKIGLTMAGR